MQRLLTEQNSNLDKKFEDWLERSARNAGNTVEDYIKSKNLQEEIEDRHKRFIELKKVLDEEPIGLTKISTILEKAVMETWTSRRLLVGYFGDDRMENAINALKEYKDEIDTTTLVSLMEQILPPGREDDGRDSKAIWVGNCLTTVNCKCTFTFTLHPEKFVDFRMERLENVS